jgi:NAD+ synthase (glutamine-hydrolysing)
MLDELTSMLADINPIGGISKTDLKKFIAYARDAFEIPILNELVQLGYWVRRAFIMCCSFLSAIPTAELEPISETYVQADEVKFLSKVFSRWR